MKIALVQQHASHDTAANLARGLKHFDEAAAAGAKLVCFAELAFEPFYPQRVAAGDVTARAQTIPGPITDAFIDRSRRHGVVTVLNLFEREGSRTFDASPVIDADGRLLGVTRMLHITDYPCFHEQGYYAPGDTGTPVYRTKAGAVGVAICYDRHYPEYMRALAIGGAELVIVPQAGALDEWPEGLYEGEMQVAAFQNGYFVALCNRVGREACLTFGGESFVCAPDGVVIARAARMEEALLVTEIDLSAVPLSHARRLFMQHRRPELYAAWVGGL
jgi:predicted amidohydrolase